MVRRPLVGEPLSRQSGQNVGMGRGKSQAVIRTSSRSTCVPDALPRPHGVENLLELEWLASSIPPVARFSDL